MQTITKKTRELGTSAGVILPRNWLNKQVTITLNQPTKEQILKDIIEILIENNLTEQTKAIYLYGSHARNDQDIESDIDILVIANQNKIINKNNYQILITTEKSLNNQNLHIQSIIKEAKPLLNKEILENKKPQIKTKPLLTEIEKILKINKDTVETCKTNNLKIPDGIVYSLILRLRELYLIKTIKKQYNKQELIQITGEKPYSAYLRIKRNKKEINNTKPEELNKIIETSEKWLKELKE